MTDNRTDKTGERPATGGDGGTPDRNDGGTSHKTKNGNGADSILDIALNYIERPWKPIPIPYREKFPVIDDWGNLEITAANANQYFNGAQQNIGVLLGPKSNGLTDIDLDCLEALRLAKEFLPPTESQFGRASKTISHLLYSIPDAPNEASLKLVDPNKDKDGKTACIIELRMGGGSKSAQTVFPGSVHESGEPIVWARDGKMGVSNYATLKAAVKKIAAAVLLVRYFPPKGSRHDAALALGGFLARAGWSANDIGDFVEIIRQVAGMGNAPGEDPTNLKRAAIDAAETYARGEKNTYGLPGLKKYFGKLTGEAVAEFLDYTEANYPLNLELAVRLWGEPSHKGKYNCQWGEDDNKKIPNIIRGDWFDFSANVGGGIRDLMRMVTAAAQDDAIAELSQTHWYGEADPLTDLKWLVADLLPETGSGLISGQQGTLKTFVALDIAAAVMNGKPVLDYEIQREGGVLFIAAEGGNTIALRLHAVIESKYTEDSKQPFAFRKISPRLLDAAALDQLAKIANDVNTKMQADFGVPLVLIIIDTIAVAAGYEKSGEENDSAISQRVMSTLAKLAQQTTTFVFGIDHFGKAVETGTRGSSAKEAAADVILALLGDRTPDGEVLNTRLAIRKRRTGESGVVHRFRKRVVDLGNDQHGKPVTSLVIDWLPGTAAPRATREAWKATKTLAKLEEAFSLAQQRSGFDYTPEEGGQAVRAVKVDDLRAAFATIYVPSSDADPEKRRKAREAAFRRGYDDAKDRQLLMAQETTGGGLVVWQLQF